MNYPVSSTNALPRNNKMEMKEEFVNQKKKHERSINSKVWPYLILILKKKYFFKIWDNWENLKLDKLFV